MNNQITNKVLMIKPIKFYFNTETAVNNIYQKNLNEDKNIVEQKALAEFNTLLEKIRSLNIEVDVIQDTSTPYTPDSIFPNNWFSSHENNILVIYPMFAKDRRFEREKFLDNLTKVINKPNLQIIDLTYFEKDNLFLEGTGALVLDRINKIAYCSLSPRAHMESLNKFCEILNFTPVVFQAIQEFKNDRIPIYHTNVMMGLGEKYAVICLESIENPTQKEHIIKSLTFAGKEIVDITSEQVLKFCGNVLELKSKDEKRYTLMSKSAFDNFTEEQKNIISKNSEIIYSDISTIETYGGGSVRCMIAEIF